MKNDKILMIVDDDSDDRFFFRTALKEIGATYQLQEAMDGEDAINKLKHSSGLPDYIFLDLNMPVMDGKKCLIELKNNSRFKKIPIVIFSTCISAREVSELGLLGATLFINKAMNILNLSNQILSAIKEIDVQQFDPFMQLKNKRGLN